MIKHIQIENTIHVSIENVDFSYRIPIKKIGKTIDWKIGEKGTPGIIIKGVSTWTLQLFTKKITEEKFIQQFQGIVNEYSSDNTINWEDTMKAVRIQNEYNTLIAVNKTADKKTSEVNFISSLKKKYQLD